LRVPHETHDSGDLGFAFKARKNGEIAIFHHGRLATTLRRDPARDFVAAVGNTSGADAQQLMARLTGNYKRANERVAGDHPRNRD
jgi:hypothetical protein